MPYRDSISILADCNPAPAALRLAYLATAARVSTSSLVAASSCAAVGGRVAVVAVPWSCTEALVDVRPACCTDAAQPEKK